MKVNNKEYNIEELIKEQKADFLKKTSKGLMLNDYERETLKKYGINYESYSKLSDIVFEIERVINENYDYEMDDLIDLSMNLSERSYYEEVNK